MIPVRLACSLALLAASGSARAATIVVTDVTDTIAAGAPISLREAILGASPGDTIAFSTAVFPVATVTTISITGSALPALNDANLVLDGGGRVQIDGSALGGSNPGLRVVADGVTIKGMDVLDFPGAGIQVLGAANTAVGTTSSSNTIRGSGGPGILVEVGAVAPSGTSIFGNLVGTSASGSTGGGNCETTLSPCGGIFVDSGASGTQVTSNVVANTIDGAGIVVLHPGTLVSGNRVGTSPDGATALGNEGAGILVAGGPGFLVDDVELTGNVVSGNDGHGILLGSQTEQAVVQGNFIGTDVTGAFAIPNGNDGIKVSGSDDHQIGGAGGGEGNVVSGNDGSGISIDGATGGNWASDTWIQGNLVGTDATGLLAVPNGRYGIVTAGKGGQHQIGGSAFATGGNLVSGNELGGVWIGDPAVTLAGNYIGTDLTGTLALPNGDNTALVTTQAVFGGVLVTGREDMIGDGAGGGNLVSGNTGHGIWIRDPGRGLRTPHLVYENFVGVDIGGTDPVPNVGDGIRVETSYVDVGAPGLGNLVAANDLVGIHVLGSDDHAVVQFTAYENEVGSDPAGLAPPGNGTGGILVEQEATNLAVDFPDIHDNRVFGNGGFGILLTGAVVEAHLSRNLIHGSEFCGIRLEDGANLGVEPPTVTSATSMLISGAIPLVHAGLAGGGEVEVFADGASEADTYLGLATIAGDTWTLAGTGGFPPLAEIRAVLWLPGYGSSALSDTCGDGCEDVHPTCDDGNPCVFTTCDEVNATCVGVNAPAGLRCSDGDGCTGVENSTTFLPDECDGLGTCIGGPELDPQVDCPWATPCNVASCGGEVGCTYEDACSGTGLLAPGVDDTVCSPDDLDQTNEVGYESDCDYCAECVPGVVGDSDADGVPDKWEDDIANGGGIDTDCDGTPDYELGTANPGNTQIYLEIDWMGLACGTAELHHHEPDPGGIADLVTVFAAHGIELVVDVDECIPESAVTVLEPNGNPLVDPDCGPGDYQSYLDIKAQHFDPRRRGVYHYAVFAHGQHIGGSDVVDRVSDGKCTAGGQSQGKSHGMDLLLAKSGGEKVLSGVAPTDSTAMITSLMHELGHNLGLKHGGPYKVGKVGGIDVVLEGAEINSLSEHNKKPNYQSSMNYRYEWALNVDDGFACEDPSSGCPNTRNYSEEQLPDLDEADLDEPLGLASGLIDPYVVRWDCEDDGTKRAGSAGSALAPIPLDWDCNDSAASASAASDLNLTNPSVPDQLLAGWEDWGALSFSFQCGYNGLEFYADEDTDEAEADLSIEDAIRLGLYGAPVAVETDIVPQCSANPVLLGSGSLVEVVLHGSGSWTPSDLIPATLRLQGAVAVRGEIADVDADSLDDLTAWFDSADLDLSGSSTRGRVEGRLISGYRLVGSDMVDPVSSLPDADADAVPDACDLCASTPANVAVDATGCP